MKAKDATDYREQFANFFIRRHSSGKVLAGRYRGQEFVLLHELTLPGWWAAEIAGAVRDVRESDLTGVALA